jgi:hypothetical protein
LVGGDTDQEGSSRTGSTSIAMLSDDCKSAPENETEGP